MKQTRVWRERIYEKTSHDIKASLDDRHASIASGRVSGSSARVSAQHIRRHTRLTAAVTGEETPRDRPRAPRTTRHSRGYKLVSRLFPGIANKRGACPPDVLFFQSYQYPIRSARPWCVDTKLIVIRLYYVPLSARPRGPIAWTCSTRTSNARTSAPAATRASHAPHHRGRRAG